VWERSYGSFPRAFTLPRRVDEDKITAEVKNGVPTITLPRAAEARGRKIEVAG
jgi:HSP20 family protein